MTDQKLIEAMLNLSVNIGTISEVVGDQDLQVKILEELAASVGEFQNETKQEIRKVATVMCADADMLKVHREFLEDFWLSEDGCLSPEE